MLRYYAYFLLISSSSVFAQNNMGSRLTAMAENGAAVDDIWSIQANTAGITNIESTSISLHYQKHSFSESLKTYAGALVIPFQNNYLGVGFQNYGFDAYNDTKINFAYAKRFGNKLSLALNINHHQLSIRNYGTAGSFSVDAGITYLWNEKVNLGAYITNLSKQDHKNKVVIAEIPHSINIGLMYTASDKVLLATSLNQISRTDLNLKLGIEYNIIEILKLRGGVSTQPFRQYAGLGFSYQNFVLDKAFSYDPNLGYSPQITIGYAF